MPHASLMTRASLLLRLTEEPDNAAAWDEFVRIYGRHVVRWCRHHGLQENDAQDVAQDVLVKFWKLASGFVYDPTRRFRSYLGVMVASAVANHTSKRRPTPLTRGGDAATLLDSLPARDDLIARIEAAYDTELLAVAMREVEGRVQPRTWRAFHMLAFEHRSGADVAAELGMAVNTAYVARKKVQRMIREVITRIETPEPAGVA